MKFLVIKGFHHQSAGDTTRVLVGVAGQEIEVKFRTDEVALKAKGFIQEIPLETPKADPPKPAAPAPTGAGSSQGGKSRDKSKQRR